MTATAITPENFEREVLESQEPVLVDFFAEWCQPCKAMAPALDEVARDLQGKIKIVKLDIDQNPTLMERYEIRGVPTLILFKDGQPASRHLGPLVQKRKLEEWVIAAAAAAGTAIVKPRAAGFKLSNGMDVVVIADPGAPRVAHAVWYRAGVGDAPRGASGIAHFLQHLALKPTENLDGDFATFAARVGNNDILFGSKDTTVYFQRVSKDDLRAVMEDEVGRMLGVHISDDELESKRRSIRDKRRVEVESRPFALLNEQIDVALYRSHPYGAPVVGWAHDIEALSREQVLSFHQRYYAPNNAVLVVAGDVSCEEVKRLATDTYGKISANPDVAHRTRPQDPPHVAARRVTLLSARVDRGWLQRSYAVPSYASAQPGEAEALDVLALVLTGGRTARLYRKLVSEAGVAIRAGGAYFGAAVDSGTIWLHTIAAGVDVGSIEAFIDATVDDVRENGITDGELERAKRALLADDIYYDGNGRDKLTYRYGQAVASGRAIEEVEGWPDAIAKVTADDVRRVAAAYLDPTRAVTGWLLPEPVAASDQAA
jgi:zinc protease